MRQGRVLVVFVLGVGMLIGWGAGSMGETEAAWTEQKTVKATLAASTIPKPIIQNCVLDTGLLGANPVVTMKWNFAAGTTYAAPANIAYAVAEGGLLSNLTVALLGQGVATSGPVAGTYTTTFSGSLLGGLLGGSYLLRLQTVDPTGWTSAPADATASMTALGGNRLCAPKPV